MRTFRECQVDDDGEPLNHLALTPLHLDHETKQYKGMYAHNRGLPCVNNLQGNAVAVLVFGPIIRGSSCNR